MGQARRLEAFRRGESVAMSLALVVVSLVLVHDLNSMCIAARPGEADAKLVVNANIVLPSPSAFERFQPVPGQRRKVAKAARLMKLIQLAASCSFDGLKPLAGFVVEELGGFRIPERTDHTLSV